MIKALLILAVIGTALSQNPSMVYTALAGNSAAASGAGAHAGKHTANIMGQQSGQTNVFMQLLNNPIRLCRETENMRAVPCAGNNICNVISMMQYRMPNLLKCSPMGVGCCLKDYMSLHLSKQLR